MPETDRTKSRRAREFGIVTVAIASAAVFSAFNASAAHADDIGGIIADLEYLGLNDDQADTIVSSLQNDGLSISQIGTLSDYYVENLDTYGENVDLARTADLALLLAYYDNGDTLTVPEYELAGEAQDGSITLAQFAEGFDIPISALTPVP